MDTDQAQMLCSLASVAWSADAERGRWASVVDQPAWRCLPRLLWLRGGHVLWYL